MSRELTPYVEAHRSGRFRAAEAPGWLARLRNEALDRFLTLGFPTTRDEEWRFTSVAPIADASFALDGESAAARGVDPAPFRAPGDRGAELVFVNGRFSAEASDAGALPRGVRVESLAAALASHPADVERHLARLAPFDQLPFVALNTAFLDDGVFIEVPAHTVVEAPIHLLFLSTGGSDGRPVMSHPRVLAVFGEGSQASIVESYASLDGGRAFTNAVAEVVLGAQAVVDHYKLQRESRAAFHVGAMHVRAGRQASFSSHAITFGGALVRNDVTTVLAGEGGHCTLDGLYVADGARHVDNHTTIDHAQPHCDSREIYKGILADRARGVFNGKIVVRPDAQKTDAKQTNRALLLSEDAQINTKPQLEIFANDVRCTHGAAVGQLDDEAMFYLRSRGLGAGEARRILIRAFASELLTRIPRAPIRAGVEEMLLQELSQALAA